MTRDDITGMVLAGGRGSRMGGVDKGLQNHEGMPLALHALMRLAPQVSEVMINANRNIAAYESLGAAVWPDALADHQGPLAGFLTALEHAATPWVMVVPCDSPRFPQDLVERLAQACVQEDADLAMPVIDEGGEPRAQPVFCLMKLSLHESLQRFLHEGGRKIDRWTATCKTALVPFADAQAFFNVNTAQDLRALQDLKR